MASVTRELGKESLINNYQLAYVQKKNGFVEAQIYDAANIQQSSETLGKFSDISPDIQSYNYQTLEIFRQKIDTFLKAKDLKFENKEIKLLNNDSSSEKSEIPSISEKPLPLLPFSPLSKSITTQRTLPLDQNSNVDTEVKNYLSVLGLTELELRDLEAKSKNDSFLFIDTLFEKFFTITNVHSLPESLLKLKDSRGYNLFLAGVSLGKNAFDLVYPFYQNRGERLETDSKGRNAIHIASISGRCELIELLIDLNFYLYLEDNDGFRPLHLAIHEGDLNVIDRFLKKGCRLDPWTHQNVEYSILALAISSGYPTVLQKILNSDKYKEQSNFQNVDGIGNYLHLAILSNHAIMLEHLLSDHAQTHQLLNTRDPQGRTPLQLAAYLGDLRAIKILHAHGDNLKHGDCVEGTAAHFAAKGQQLQAIQYLEWLDSSIIRSLDKESHTPIHFVENKKTLKEKECHALLSRLLHEGRIEKTEPPNFSRRPPFNLVFQGGGPRGIAYLGALEILMGQNVLSQLERVAGTSAGAITAAFLAIGCDIEKLKKYLNDNFGKFLDANGNFEVGLLNAIKEESTSKALSSLLKEFWNDFSLLHPKRSIQSFKAKLLNMTHLASGEGIKGWLEKIITEETGHKDCTFGDLKKLRDSNPERFKELHVFALQLPEDSSILLQGPLPECTRFSCENPEWHNLIIADAIRASISIPGVFRPHTLRFNDNGRIYDDTKNRKFIDAGLIRNFPIDAFDHEKYQEDRFFRGEKTNRRTLGLCLQDVPEVSINLKEEGQKEYEGINLLKTLFNTLYFAEQILLEETAAYKDRSIIIPIKGVSLLDFDVKDDKKQEMILSGKEQASIFFLTK